jgi:hypothetical protein
MRRFSYILGFLTVALFILAAASPANATPIDPGIIIQNTPVVPLSGGTNFISGNTFLFATTTFNDCNFITPAVTTNDCAVKNTGTATWTAITFDIGPLQPIPLSCAATAFFSGCTIANDSDGDVVATFFGGTGVPVNNSPDLFINIFGWAPGTTFDATISTPEPGTLALLLVGGGFFLARKRRQNVSHA